MSRFLPAGIQNPNVLPHVVSPADGEKRFDQSHAWPRLEVDGHDDLVSCCGP